MKNIKQIIGLVILLSVFIGCEKWVDFDPHDEYAVTELDYLKTESDYQSFANSCYSPLQWMNQLVVVGDVASDNATAGGEHANDVLNLQQIDDYTATPQNGHTEELWKVTYEGINRVNYMIQHKDANVAGENINFTGKEIMYGELKFLRAYYYFSLVRLFGDVVLFTDKRLGIAEFGTLQRSPKADVYKQMEIDLNEAIAVLPTTSAQTGRITKYAAQALLGKVFLYENKFTEAAAMLENVVNGPFILTPNYDDIFLKSNEFNSESIFEIVYSNGSPYWNWGGATRGQGNYAVQQCGVRDLVGASAMPFAGGWSTTLPSQNLAAAFAVGDTRKDATCLDMDAYIIANPSLFVNGTITYVPSTDPAFSVPTATKKPAYKVAPYKNTGFYNKKYLPRKGQTSGQPELNYDNNQRIIRLGDVLLMAAEANNRATVPNDTKALNYLNRVRDRAFGDALHHVTATGTALKTAIWDERRLELGMEGDRFFDLVRTGQAAAKITGFIVGKNEVFPIPQREIDISKLTQNPNW